MTLDKLHFLDMSEEQQAQYRDKKVIDGVLFFVICLLPGTPMFCHLSLFYAVSQKPVFVKMIFQEQWDDDGYLLYLKKQLFQ